MPYPTTPLAQPAMQDAQTWVPYLSEGAVSIDIEGSTIVLRASQTIQERFEVLLARRKTGTLSYEEACEYEALCGLDTALSWLNRLARSASVSAR